ncbi:hypothetical protein NPIL_83861 [Nephila pilipes]|uniref:Uncharacterized protein n=1 Tax=Nephila pilipes TaxID=299642 RepID=A0A8X6QR48_NEPPI|nr:hypothetical protein NPIL_83861 [Nephila pilipes]
MVKIILIRRYVPYPDCLNSKPWSVMGVREIFGGFPRKIALKSAAWVFMLQSVKFQMNRTKEYYYFFVRFAYLHTHFRIPTRPHLRTWVKMVI